MVQKKIVRKSLRKSNRKNKILKKGGSWNGSIFINRGNSCYLDSLLFPLFYFKMQYPRTLISTQITDKILEYNNVSYKYNKVLRAIQNKWDEFQNPNSKLNVCDDVMREYADSVGGRRTEQRDSLEFFLNTFEFISNSNIFNIITEHKKCYQRIKGNSNIKVLDVEPKEGRNFNRIKNIDEKFVKIETNNKKYDKLNNLQDYINEYVEETEEFNISDYQFRKKTDGTYNRDRHGDHLRDKEPTKNHASNNPDYPYSIITKDTKTRNFVNTQILIIQLVREKFQGDDYINDKNINIPTTLTIGQYEFILRFATIKTGGPSGGHWMAMINKPDEDGLMFYNDIGPSFEKAKNINLLNTNGFHFFYEKIGGKPNHTVNSTTQQFQNVSVGPSGTHSQQAPPPTYNSVMSEPTPPPSYVNSQQLSLQQPPPNLLKAVPRPSQSLIQKKSKEERINEDVIKESEKLKLYLNTGDIEQDDVINLIKIIREIRSRSSDSPSAPFTAIEKVPNKNKKRYQQILESMGYDFTNHTAGGKRNNKNKSNRKLKSKNNKSNKKQKNKLKSKSKKSNKK